MTLSAPSWRVKRTPCPFYARGNCIFSERCNFLHIQEDDRTLVEPEAYVVRHETKRREIPPEPVAQIPEPEQPKADLEPVVPRKSRRSFFPKRMGSDAATRMSAMLRELKGVIGEKDREPEEELAALPLPTVDTYSPSPPTQVASPEPISAPSRASHSLYEPLDPPPDLLSPVSMPDLHLRSFSRDYDNVSDTSLATWVTPIPFSLSPPHTPAMSSTFDLLSSPFGSPSSKLTSPHLASFASRFNPLSPPKAEPQEEQPQLDLDELDSPSTHKFAGKTIQPSARQLDDSPPLRVEQDDTGLTARWDSSGQDTALFIGSLSDRDIKEALKRPLPTEYLASHQDFNVEEATTSSPTPPPQRSRNLPEEADNENDSDPDEVVQLAYLDDTDVSPRQDETLHNIYDAYSDDDDSDRDSLNTDSEDMHNNQLDPGLIAPPPVMTPHSTLRHSLVFSPPKEKTFGESLGVHEAAFADLESSRESLDLHPPSLDRQDPPPTPSRFRPWQSPFAPPPRPAEGEGHFRSRQSSGDDTPLSTPPESSRSGSGHSASAEPSAKVPFGFRKPNQQPSQRSSVLVERAGPGVPPVLRENIKEEELHGVGDSTSPVSFKAAAKGLKPLRLSTILTPENISPFASPRNSSSFTPRMGSGNLKHASLSSAVSSHTSTNKVMLSHLPHISEDFLNYNTPPVLRAPLGPMSAPLEQQVWPKFINPEGSVSAGGAPKSTLGHTQAQDEGYFERPVGKSSQERFEKEMVDMIEEQAVDGFKFPAGQQLAYKENTILEEDEGDIFDGYRDFSTPDKTDPLSALSNDHAEEIEEMQVEEYIGQSGHGTLQSFERSFQQLEDSIQHPFQRTPQQSNEQIHPPFQRSLPQSVKKGTAQRSPEQSPRLVQQFSFEGADDEEGEYSQGQFVDAEDMEDYTPQAEDEFIRRPISETQDSAPNHVPQVSEHEPHSSEGQSISALAQQEPWHSKQPSVLSPPPQGWVEPPRASAISPGELAKSVSPAISLRQSIVSSRESTSSSHHRRSSRAEVSPPPQASRSKQSVASQSISSLQPSPMLSALREELFESLSQPFTPLEQPDTPPERSLHKTATSSKASGSFREQPVAGASSHHEPAATSSRQGSDASSAHRSISSRQSASSQQRPATDLSPKRTVASLPEPAHLPAHSASFQHDLQAAPSRHQSASSEQQLATDVSPEQTTTSCSELDHFSAHSTSPSYNSHATSSRQRSDVSPQQSITSPSESVHFPAHSLSASTQHESHDASSREQSIAPSSRQQSMSASSRPQSVATASRQQSVASSFRQHSPPPSRQPSVATPSRQHSVSSHPESLKSQGHSQRQSFGPARHQQAEAGHIYEEQSAASSVSSRRSAVRPTSRQQSKANATPKHESAAFHPSLRSPSTSTSQRQSLPVSPEQDPLVSPRHSPPSSQGHYAPVSQTHLASSSVSQKSLSTSQTQSPPSSSQQSTSPRQSTTPQRQLSSLLTSEKHSPSEAPSVDYSPAPEDGVVPRPLSAAQAPSRSSTPSPAPSIHRQSTASRHGVPKSHQQSVSVVASQGQMSSSASQQQSYPGSASQRQSPSESHRKAASPFSHQQSPSGSPSSPGVTPSQIQSAHSPLSIHDAEWVKSPPQIQRQAEFTISPLQEVQSVGQGTMAENMPAAPSTQEEDLTVRLSRGHEPPPLIPVYDDSGFSQELTIHPPSPSAEDPSPIGSVEPQYATVPPVPQDGIPRTAPLPHEHHRIPSSRKESLEVNANLANGRRISVHDDAAAPRSAPLRPFAHRNGSLDPMDARQTLSPVIANSPLRSAASAGQRPLSVAVTTPKPALMFAIASDDPEEVRRVLATGEAGPNDNVGPQSALAFTLANDQLAHKLDIVKVLLEYGADTSELKDQDQALAKVLMDQVDDATRYYLSKAETALTRKTDALMKRSSFKPIAKLRYGIIGQDRALEQLFRVLSMHNQKISTTPIVMLLCGPSGHGKSLLAQKFGGLLDVPTHTVNMTTLRSAHDLWQSYSITPELNGNSRCTLVEFLINNEGKRAIVVLDEIEKTKEDSVLWSLLLPWESGRCSFEANSMNIDVRNVVWLGTSNIGQDLIFEHHTKLHKPEEVMTRNEYVELMGSVRPRVSDRLGASVLSRVTTILPFVPFTMEEKRALASEALSGISSDITAELGREAMQGVVDGALEEFIPEEGARSIYRAVSSLVVDAMDLI